MNFRRSILGRNSVIYALLICAMGLNAQTAISGHVNLEDDKTWEPMVHLVKINAEDIDQKNPSTPTSLGLRRTGALRGTAVATVPINGDGHFSFHKKHISDKNSIYQIYVDRMEKAINDTLANSAPFILSKSDSMYFGKGGDAFSEYTTTNLADREWKRLQEFEAGLQQSQSVGDKDFYPLKSYAKDSLQILMVKLMGIRQLKDKALLDQDIAKNPDYYLALLAELKESGLPPSDYAFLEKELAYLSIETVEQQYALSKAINIFLGVLVLGLLVVLVVHKKKQPDVGDLSKQERRVQKLILAGKSNKEIAKELFISLSTVKSHITNIYGKLQVSSRQELLQKAQN